MQALLAEGDTTALNRRTEQLKEAIMNTISNQDSELLAQRCYEHMLIRMRQSLLIIKINSRKIEESLSNKGTILDEEQSKEIKNKEQLKQSQNVLKTLMDHVDKDNKNRSERIEGLRRTIHNKEDAVSRRLDRLQRQKDIVEKAADNQEQSEVKLRENLLVQKFWNSFLKRKMGKEMEANSQIEEAFQKIRTATGITDIQEIMKKFVSREQTYSQLLFLVGENEKKLNDAKQRNKDLTEKLNQARIINADDKSSEESTDVEDIYKEIDSFQHDLKKVSIKHQSTHIVLGQLSEWVLKIMSKVEKILSKTKCDDILSKSHAADCKDPISIMAALADMITETFSKVGFADVSNYNIKNYAEGLRSNAEFQKMVRVKARAKSAHKSEDGQSHSNKPYESEENNGEKESREMNVEIEDERKRIKKEDDSIIKQMKDDKKEIKRIKKKEDTEEEPTKDEPDNK
jgi:hypothetical protein